MYMRGNEQMMDGAESVDAESKSDCPPATKDVAINTKNRNATIKNYGYGPLNVEEPADFWKDIAKQWKTTEKAAKKSKCGNCVAFDRSPRMKDCMPGETSDGEGVLGYCWMHHFKCHSARTCDTWAKGGPITTDKVSEGWGERAFPKTEMKGGGHMDFGSETFNAIEIAESFNAEDSPPIEYPQYRRRINYLEMIYNAFYDPESSIYQVVNGQSSGAISYGEGFIQPAQAIFFDLRNGSSQLDGQRLSFRYGGNRGSRYKLETNVKNALQRASGTKLSSSGRLHHGGLIGADYEYNGKMFFVRYNMRGRGSSRRTTLSVASQDSIPEYRRGDYPFSRAYEHENDYKYQGGAESDEKREVQKYRIGDMKVREYDDGTLERYEAQRIQYDYMVHREPRGTEVDDDGNRIPNPRGGRFTSADAETLGAETFEAPSCNCERFDRSAWDSNRCATCGEMRKGHYGAETFEAEENPKCYCLSTQPDLSNDVWEEVSDGVVMQGPFTSDGGRKYWYCAYCGSKGAETLGAEEVNGGYNDCCSSENIVVHHKGGANYHDDDNELSYYPAECRVCGVEYDAGLSMYGNSSSIQDLEVSALGAETFSAETFLANEMPFKSFWLVAKKGSKSFPAGQVGELRVYENGERTIVLDNNLIIPFYNQDLAYAYLNEHFMVYPKKGTADKGMLMRAEGDHDDHDHDHEDIDELIEKINRVTDFAITFIHDGGFGGEPKGIIIDEELGLKTEIVNYVEGSIDLRLVRDLETNELVSVRFALTGDPDETPILYLPLPERLTTVPEEERSVKES